MAEPNSAEKRRLEDMSVTFPPKDIVCKDCMFKRSGVLGYRTAYCEMYPRGKPDSILFDKAKCEYKQVYS